MTVSSVVVTAGPTSTNGVTTVFGFTFRVDAYNDVTQKSQVVVTRVLTSTGAETVLTVDSDYTISFNSDQDASPGGSVTISPAPASGYKLYLRAAPSLLQSTELQDQGAYNASAVEAEMDNLAKGILDLNDRLNGAPYLSVQKGPSFSGKITGPITPGYAPIIAGDGLSWALGSAAAGGTVSTAMQPVTAASSLASARALLNVSPAGVVMMVRSGPGWAAYDPSGAVIDISASTTQGLQEAITYGFANGYPVLVRGSGTITCSTAVAVPAGYLDYLEIDPTITINFSALGSANLITINSLENGTVKIKGLVVQHSGDTGACIAIKPTSAAPSTGNTVVAASILEFGDCAPASGGIGLLFDITTASILGNRIFISDVNGGVSGIKVTSPGTAFLVFEENEITWTYVHGQSGFGVQQGTGATNQSGLRRNRWMCGRLSPVGATAAIATYGSNDTFISPFATNEEGSYTYGLQFKAGANDNVALAPKIVGATTAPINDLGIGNEIVGQPRITSVGDVDYTILLSDRLVLITTQLTAPRTHTLPAAANFREGTPLIIASTVNCVAGVIVSRAGSDTLNGGSTLTFAPSRAGLQFISDGVSAWTIATIEKNQISLNTLTNDRSAQMTSYTVKGNLTNATANMSDMNVRDLLGYAPGIPGVYPGRWNTGLIFNAAATGTLTLTANKLYAAPFFAGSKQTWTKIGVNITSGAAAKHIRLGIFTCATSGATQGAPDVLVLDCGVIATDATGTISATISQALEVGWYYLVMVCDDSTVVVTAQAIGTNNANHYSAMIGVAAFGTPDVQMTKSFTYGVLSGATPFGTPTFAAANVPIIAMQV